MTERARTSRRTELVAAPALGLQFALELCALAALACWGYDAGASTAGRIALAATAVGAAVVFWALLGSPKAPHHVRGAGRVLVELVFFGSAALALWSASSGALAAGFAGLAALNSTILRLLGEYG